ncbi:hypothetical protein [Desulfocicer vacuolatum]|nr:hypothetical protein [Desulfocicer vacuolatum]
MSFGKIDGFKRLFKNYFQGVDLSNFAGDMSALSQISPFKMLFKHNVVFY